MIYTLVFDEEIIKQLKKVDGNIKNILSKMFDKLELGGPIVGKLLDSKLFIYEIKNKHSLLGFILGIMLLLTKYMFLNLRWKQVQKNNCSPLKE